jgi:hypothetical protein
MLHIAKTGNRLRANYAAIQHLTE